MKIIAIIKKEYKAIVKKKSFLISTLLMPVLMAGMMFLPMLIMRAGRGEKTIAVADYPGNIYPQLEAITRKVQPQKSPPGKTGSAIDPTSGRQQVMSGTRIKLQPAATAGRTADQIAAEFRERILKKEVDGLLIIPADIKAKRSITYYSTNVSDFYINEYFSSLLRTIVSQQLLLEHNINPQVVSEATRNVTMDTFKVSASGTSRASSGIEFMMSIFMLVILFSILIGYGQLIMRGVLEEKTNRIMEVLISSVRASHIFYGKIIGIALAGLTQLAIWTLIGAFLVLNFSTSIDPSILNFLTVPVALYFVLFFLLGYAMFAILFAIVGASVNTDQEAQQYTAIISWIIILPYIFGIAAVQNPSMPLAVVLSFIPLFSPLIMFTRILASMPPPFQILASIGLNLAFIVFLAWVGAKIFRTGILMYGKKPTLGEILRWVRYK